MCALQAYPLCNTIWAVLDAKKPLQRWPSLLHTPPRPQNTSNTDNPDPLYRRQRVRAVKDLITLPERGLCRSGEAVRRRTTSFWSLWGTNFGFLKLLCLSIETMRIMQQLQNLMVVIIWHFGFSIQILPKLLRLHFAFARQTKIYPGWALAIRR